MDVHIICFSKKKTIEEFISSSNYAGQRCSQTRHCIQYSVERVTTVWKYFKSSGHFIPTK